MFYILFGLTGLTRFVALCRFGNFEKETAVAALRHGLNQKLHFAPLPKSHLPRFEVTSA